MLTGHKDTDRLVLLQLEDHELGPVCQVNKYVNELCQEELFWKMRVLNKFNKSLEDVIKTLTEKNSKLLTEVKKIDLTYDNMEDVKRFYGFDSFKKLNSYLTTLPLSAIYRALYIVSIDREINKIYTIDKNKLPDFIDYEKLVYNLRRKYVFSKYGNKNNRKFSTSLDYTLPGLTVLFPSRAIPIESYEYFRELGVKN